RRHGRRLNGPLYNFLGVRVEATLQTERQQLGIEPEKERFVQRVRARPLAAQFDCRAALCLRLLDHGFDLPVMRMKTGDVGYLKKTGEAQLLDDFEHLLSELPLLRGREVGDVNLAGVGLILSRDD